jgi:hypothetical protein
MAASSVQICNIALIRIGVDTIVGLTDSSKQGRLCNTLFQDTFDAILEAFDWVCARAQATLAADATEPTHTWDYRYLMPADPYCLKLLSVCNTEGEEVPYAIFGRYIYTDEEDGLNISYIKRLTVYADLSPELVQATAMKLAQSLLPSFTWTAARKASIDEDYKKAILQAKINGAAQDYCTDEKENSATYGGNDEWVSAGD